MGGVIMSDVVINEVNGIDVIQYQPKGVCAKMMQIRVKDDIVQDVEFVGGCNGNLSGIGILVKGMHIDDVIARLNGITCGYKRTSCPDQLCRALEKIKADV